MNTLRNKGKMIMQSALLWDPALTHSGFGLKFNGDRAGKMAQQVKMFAVKLVNVSLIPRSQGGRR